MRRIGCLLPACRNLSALHSFPSLCSLALSSMQLCCLRLIIQSFVILWDLSFFFFWARFLTTMTSADFSLKLSLRRPPTVSPFTFHEWCRIYTQRLRITLWRRSLLPAYHPLICLISCFCSSSPIFAFSFLQTLLRSSALAFSYSSQLSTPVTDLHP